MSPQERAIVGKPDRKRRKHVRALLRRACSRYKQYKQVPVVQLKRPQNPQLQAAAQTLTAAMDVMRVPWKCTSKALPSAADVQGATETLKEMLVDRSPRVRCDAAEFLLDALRKLQSTEEQAHAQLCAVVLAPWVLPFSSVRVLARRQRAAARAAHLALSNMWTCIKLCAMQSSLVLGTLTMYLPSGLDSKTLAETHRRMRTLVAAARRVRVLPDEMVRLIVTYCCEHAFRGALTRAAPADAVPVVASLVSEFQAKCN